MERKHERLYVSSSRGESMNGKTFALFVFYARDANRVDEMHSNKHAMVLGNQVKRGDMHESLGLAWHRQH